MRILIAGGSGFIGRCLIDTWVRSHEITLLGRDLRKLQYHFPALKCVNWEQLDSLSSKEFDVVINLAGESINHLRWTAAIKKKILESRITVTQKLVQWVLTDPNPSLQFCNASALSIYGLYKKIPLINNTEIRPISNHHELLCQVAQRWEDCLQPLIEHAIKTSILRFAVVLDKKQGAFPQLLRPAKLGLASKMGAGLQPFSWISITDLIRAIDWIIEKQMIGPINMVAPDILTQEEFNHTLCTYLHRPYFLKLPTVVVKLLFGDLGDELLLKGPSGTPQVLKNSGFIFTQPRLQDFLSQDLNKDPEDKY